LTEESEDETHIKNKERITKLHDDRILSGERNFLEIVEKNHFEKLNVWHPKNCWERGIWNLLYGWYTIKLYCKFIIEHPLFDTLVILLILTNSVTLAMYDPTASTEKDYEITLKYVYLTLYTIEMVLKILGMGFVFNHGAY